MTVVGDLAQAGPTTTITAWRDALGPFIEDRFDHHRLTVNYRTTAEILRSTAPLLSRIAPDQELSDSIRHGVDPIIITVEENCVKEKLADLLSEIDRDNPEDLVGVVSTAERLAELSVSSVSSVAAPEARGLEFDIVIIVDPEAIENSGEAGLRDLYVAHTRATKRLYILQGRPN